MRRRSRRSRAIRIRGTNTWRDLRDFLMYCLRLLLLLPRHLCLHFTRARIPCTPHHPLKPNLHHPRPAVTRRVREQHRLSTLIPARIRMATIIQLQIRHPLLAHRVCAHWRLVYQHGLCPPRDQGLGSGIGEIEIGGYAEGLEDADEGVEEG